MEPPVEKSYLQFGEFRRGVFLPYLPESLHTLEYTVLAKWVKAQMLLDVRENSNQRMKNLAYGDKPSTIQPTCWPASLMDWYRVTNFARQQRLGIKRTDLKVVLREAAVARLHQFGINEDQHLLPGGRLKAHKHLFLKCKRDYVKRCSALKEKKRQEQASVPEKAVARLMRSKTNSIGFEASETDPVCQDKCIHYLCSRIKMKRIKSEVVGLLSSCFKCHIQTVRECPCKKIYFCSSVCRKFSVIHHHCTKTK